MIFKSKKQKVIKLLKDLASEGDIQAQKMLHLYEELEAHTPIYESLPVLKDSQALDNIVKCIKKANLPTDDK